MTFPEINGTLAGQNLGYLFTYANAVTNSFFGLFMVIGFFLVLLIGSLFAQLRITGRMRFDVSFLASSFVTLLFATVLMQWNGVLNPVYFIILLVMTVVSFMWVAFSQQ